MNVWRDELEKLLEKDPDAQRLILEAVRENIKHYQYDPQSIPFELFQNADDAVVELAEMMGDDPLGPNATRFVVSWDKQKISFIHWGRPINQFRYGTTDWRGLGYDRDLEKMLVLSYSDKLVEADTREEPITGKFGLGFKSVFLITDSPRVISGRLKFKVVGGMYPQLLPPEEVKNLRRQLEEFRSSPRSQRQGTIIELPLADEIGPKKVLEDFFNLVHVLLVFARRIKRMDIQPSCRLDAETNTFWKEQPLLDTQDVYFGTLEPVTGDETQAIVLRSQKRGQEGALLLTLDSRGFSRLSPSVPTIWVTNPTQHRLDFGFAINGPFDLDVGRAQLAANSERNDELAQSIGENIGESLCQLFDASEQDWGAFCRALNLAADVRPYEFWKSFWELWKDFFSKASASDQDKVIGLLRDLLWGNSQKPRGVAKLIKERRALPTLLWSEHKTLTRLDEVRFAVKGALNKRSVFNIVSKWPSFAQKVQPGAAVSVSSSVEQAINKLLPNALENLSLCRILEWEIGSNYKATPTMAQRLGRLITRQWISELDPAEKEKIDEELKKVHFRGRDGRYHPAKELLIAHDDAIEDQELDEYERQDEQKRARFAPSDKILGDDYRGTELLFFKACRQRMEANVDAMMVWALSARGDEQRLGVIRYLLEGQLSQALAEKLKFQFRTTSNWLSKLDDNQLEQAFKIFDINQRKVILGLLGHYGPSPIPTLKSVDPAKTLPEIWKWWHAERKLYTSEYERQTYPNGACLIHTSAFDPDSQEDREGWLSLLLLGSFHTMGRTIPGQHRNFLQLCWDKGWLQVFANQERDPDKWIEVLEQYLDVQVDESEYYQWMRQYVSIYQLARWLSEYVESYLAVDRRKKPFSLDQILNPRASKQQQLGGLDAPPIERTLGIGACFVMRELVRQGVLKSPFAFEHCYVPSKQIRLLFIRLGCRNLDYDCANVHDSRTIYRFLVEHLGEERAIFDRSFDLPFLTLCDNSNLKYRFMRCWGSK